MTGIARIAQERRRQIDSEGWAPGHDDVHTRGELVAAAACYVWAAQQQITQRDVTWRMQMNGPFNWPWEPTWWKPSEDPVRNLVKAAALIAAEIDRLTRAHRTS